MTSKPTRVRRRLIAIAVAAAAVLTGCADKESHRGANASLIEGRVLLRWQFIFTEQQRVGLCNLYAANKDGVVGELASQELGVEAMMAETLENRRDAIDAWEAKLDDKC